LFFFGSFRWLYLMAVLSSRGYAAYAALGSCGIAYFAFTRACDRDFSVLVTAGAFLQLTAVFFIHTKVKEEGIGAWKNISILTLQLLALVLTSRLLANVMYSGYVPLDPSGDWVFPTADMASLLLVADLLLKAQDKAVKRPVETFDPSYVVGGCALLAFYFHGSANNSALFDMLWAFSMYLEAVVLVPQLQLIDNEWTRVGRGPTTHFIFAMLLSRCCALIFWWYCANEIGHRIASKLVIGSHFLQLGVAMNFVSMSVTDRMAPPSPEKVK
jgi:hypothetical protein